MKWKTTRHQAPQPQWNKRAFNWRPKLL